MLLVVELELVVEVVEVEVVVVLGWAVVVVEDVVDEDVVVVLKQLILSTQGIEPPVITVFGRSFLYFNPLFEKRGIKNECLVFPTLPCESDAILFRVCLQEGY